MFFKLFKKNKTNDNNKSYKDKILEKRDKNVEIEKKRIKKELGWRLEHMVKDGYICSSLNPSLDYLNVYSLNTYLKELEELEEYDGIYFKTYEYVNETMIEIGIKREN